MSFFGYFLQTSDFAPRAIEVAIKELTAVANPKEGLTNNFDMCNLLPVFLTSHESTYYLINMLIQLRHLH